MNRRDRLSIGEVAARAGVSVPTLRFYEESGLVTSTRDAARRRQYERVVLRRLAVIRAGQRFGLTLAEIADAFAALPVDRAPTKRDWQRLSRRWQELLDTRIAALIALRDGLESCIGCGCLSLRSCPMYNRDDEFANRGPGAGRWPQPLR